jgi:lysosomal-associated membrane protein 1/2
MYKTLGFLFFLTLFFTIKAEDHLCQFHYNVDGDTCVIMNMTVNLTVFYRNASDDDTSYALDELCDSDMVPMILQNDSYCNQTFSDRPYNETKLALSFNESTINITFYFQVYNETGSRQWNVSKLEFSISNEFIPHIKNQDNITAGYKDSDLFGSLDYQRSYFCNSTNDISGFTVNASNVSVTLTLAQFQVQAFVFDTYNSTVFGDAARCSQDIKGSKIVPIAVGAALAGLVIIVLIAYIIGRLRSRRQSSYEALS